jgi:hypothetical protein
MRKDALKGRKQEGVVHRSGGYLPARHGSTTHRGDQQVSPRRRYEAETTRAPSREVLPKFRTALLSSERRTRASA